VHRCGCRPSPEVLEFWCTARTPRPLSCFSGIPLYQSHDATTTYLYQRRVPATATPVLLLCVVAARLSIYPAEHTRRRFGGLFRPLPIPSPIPARCPRDSPSIWTGRGMQSQGKGNGIHLPPSASLPPLAQSGSPREWPPARHGLRPPLTRAHAPTGKWTRRAVASGRQRD